MIKKRPENNASIKYKCELGLVLFLIQQLLVGKIIQRQSS